MSDPRIVITDDGNQRLTVINGRLDKMLSENPADHPKLTGAMLMGGAATDPTDTRVRTEIDKLFSREDRALWVGLGIYHSFISNPIILHELYLQGCSTQGQSFVQTLKETMRPDSLASGLSDAELQLSWHAFRYTLEKVAQKGREWRKRKDWRG